MEHHEKDSNLKPTFKAQAEHTNGILGLKEKLRTNVQFEGKKKLLQRNEEKNIILFWFDI